METLDVVMQWTGRAIFCLGGLFLALVLISFFIDRILKYTKQMQLIGEFLYMKLTPKGQSTLKEIERLAEEREKGKDASSV